MQTRIEEHKYARYSFDSLYELGAYTDATPKTWRHLEGSSRKSSGMDWDMDIDYPTAVRMAREGWPEGADKMQDALKQFAPMTPAPDTKVDFYGFRPHVPRFCAGAPASMIRHAPKADSGSGRVLTLAVPVNALSNVDARSMSNFGVAVTQYVNQLEASGVRVELIGMMVSDVGGWRVAHSWIIKYASQPLDLAVVAFSIGHPAMFRRLGFALRERCAAPPQSNYGFTADAEISDLINPAPGTVILNGMKDANKHATTPAKALEYVSAQIEKAMGAQYA